MAIPGLTTGRGEKLKAEIAEFLRRGIAAKKVADNDYPIDGPWVYQVIENIALGIEEIDRTISLACKIKQIEILFL